MEVVKQSEKVLSKLLWKMTMNSSRKRLSCNTDKKEEKPGVTLSECRADRPLRLQSGKPEFVRS